MHLSQPDTQPSCCPCLVYLAPAGPQQKLEGSTCGRGGGVRVQPYSHDPAACSLASKTFGSGFCCPWDHAQPLALGAKMPAIALGRSQGHSPAPSTLGVVAAGGSRIGPIQLSTLQLWGCRARRARVCKENSEIGAWVNPPPSHPLSSSFPLSLLLYFSLQFSALAGQEPFQPPTELLGDCPCSGACSGASRHCTGRYTSRTVGSRKPPSTPVPKPVNLESPQKCPWLRGHSSLSCPVPQACPGCGRAPAAQVGERRLLLENWVWWQYGEQGPGAPRPGRLRKEDTDLSTSASLGS